MRKTLTKLVAGMSLKNAIEVREGEPIEVSMARHIAILDAQLEKMIHPCWLRCFVWAGDESEIDPEEVIGTHDDGKYGSCKCNSLIK